MGVFLYYAINAYTLVLVARAVGSFFVRDWSTGIPRILWDFTEPVLAPVRRFIPPLGGFDLSVMIVIVVLRIVANFFLVGRFGL
ncbi:MAG: YggT family protein [Chloroflexota bacterium]|jgi:YggT family protein|nr:YggT family protein [Chloroflexota bacterium]